MPNIKFSTKGVFFRKIVLSNAGSPKDEKSVKDQEFKDVANGKCGFYGLRCNCKESLKKRD